MALNPAFADASINPSQTMGNDASVNPTQGALPTANYNQPQYTMPFNQPSTFDISQNAYLNSINRQSESGGIKPSYEDWSNSQMNRLGGGQSTQGMDLSLQPPLTPLQPPSGSLAPPESEYSPPTSDDGKWFYSSGQWRPNEQISLSPNEPNNAPTENTNFGLPQTSSPVYTPTPGQQYEDLKKQYAGINPFAASIGQQPQGTYMPFNPTDYSKNDASLPQNIQDFLKKDRIGSASDAGGGWSYDPTTQKFNSYTMGGSQTKSLAEMQDYVNNQGKPPAIVQGALGNANTAQQPLGSMPPMPQGNMPQIGRPLGRFIPSATLPDGTRNSEGGSYEYPQPVNEYGYNQGNPQLPLQQDPPSRYTYFGNDKTDYSQLGLSQTALDSLNMMRQAPDMGQFYYDTQTKTFGQGVGHPGPSGMGQRVYKGKTGIPLELMNKLGSGEAVDFSKYAQYDEGMPLPPQIGDQPLPEQQTQVLGPQVPYEDPRATIGPTFTQRNPLTPTATSTGTTNMATNPLSQMAVTPAAAYTPAPVVGTASSGGGSFTQGAPLPNITTTQQQVTAAPEFYTDYLNQLAKQGASTAQNAQYVGATDLQNQAFNQTAQNVGNYQPTLQSAINMAQNVGDSNLYKAVGELGQANIARNLAPQATAGIVGSGQFGSKRGAAALGDTIANAQLGITAQQAQALQQDMQNRIAASQQLGNLASTTQQLGLGDINALATMGGQKQTIAQNEQLFPMQQLTNQSQLLRGYTIPTSTGSSYTGPIPGAYAASPLQQIAGLGALGAGISNTPMGTALGKLFSGATDASTTALAKLLGITSGTTAAVPGTNETNLPIINTPGGGTATPNGDGSYTTSDGRIVGVDGNPIPGYVYPDPGGNDEMPFPDNFDYNTPLFDYSGFQE